MLNLSRLVFVVYIMCFKLNSTLPRHRDASTKDYTNKSQRFHFLDRTKEMASKFEDKLRNIKDNTHELGNNIYDHINIGFKNLTNNNAVNEDDVRQYEKMVIMKKYPFLDLHELEMKYCPVEIKNSRRSDSLYLDRNLQREPSINEPEDIINVEITNRGLTGFAIPPLLTQFHVVQSKSKNVDEKYETSGNPEVNILGKKSSNEDLLRSLTEDINAYMERKSVE